MALKKRSKILDQAREVSSVINAGDDRSSDGVAEGGRDVGTNALCFVL